MGRDRDAALQWGRETLRELRDDSEVPSALREEAARLWPAYPLPATFIDSLFSAEAPLKDAHADALQLAQTLFEQVHQLQLGSGGTRRLVAHTLRLVFMLAAGSRVVDADRGADRI